MADTSTSRIRYGRVAPGICVRDIAAAHDFYARVLGFQTVFENGDPVGFMVMKKDAAEIHLSLKRDHTPSTINVAHLIVDDAAALYAVCQAAGVRIVKCLMDKDYGQRAFVIADPDGNCIDIGEPIG
jgi:catechol 2,3-dioxygenase-like lactoylglutathione lyase family enzyme